MVDDPIDSKGFSLRRWSRRKLGAARDADRPPHPPASDAQIPPRAEASPRIPGVAAHGSRAPESPLPVASGAATEPPALEAPLPPVESLTFDSDFTAFMRPGVDADVRRSAVRKLVRDPRFNVMDGLDVYIDDYSKPSPLAPELVRTLMQARYIFNPPQTRVNEEGIVEDVLPDEPRDARAGESAAPADLRNAADEASAPVQSVSAIAQPDAVAPAQTGGAADAGQPVQSEDAARRTEADSR